MVFFLLLSFGMLSAASPESPSGGLKPPPQGYTDKSMDFLAKRDGSYGYPSSIPIITLHSGPAQLPEVSGVLSLNNGTITLTFRVELGIVPFQLVNTDTKAVIATYQTNVPAGEMYVIHISELPAGAYELAYYVPGKEPMAALFEIPEAEEEE